MCYSFENVERNRPSDKITIYRGIILFPNATTAERQPEAEETAKQKKERKGREKRNAIVAALDRGFRSELPKLNCLFSFA